MIEFHGLYFDGKSSKAYPITIRSDGVFFSVQGDGDYPRTELPLHQCVISPPMSNTRGIIKLPDGAQCETDNLNAVEELEKFLYGNSGMRTVHFLEGHWKTAFACLAGMILCVWIFIAQGIPVLADIISRSVPPVLLEKLSQQALNMLDKQFFEPSQLTPERASQIQGLFQQICQEKSDKFNYRLEFRKSPHIGANAFALPSGHVLMTDEMVAISENDNELRGVLAHETAHVIHRHGIRSIIQNAGVFLVISILVGDITSITSLAAALPTLLVEAGYSRKFEKEADKAAGLYFIQKGLDTADYRNILIRVTKDYDSKMSLISTHPDTQDRVKYLQSLETSK